MTAETVRRLLVVAVCALGVMVLHLWPTDAQSPSGHPREQAAPVETTRAPASPESRPGPTRSSPSEPPAPRWDPDERWDTHSPQPPGSTPPSDGTSPSAPPSTPSAPPSSPSSPPSSEPDKTPPSSSSPPTTSTTPTKPTPPSPTPPTDPPTSEDPEPLPAPESVEVKEVEEGYKVTWTPVEGAVRYIVYVDGEPHDVTETSIVVDEDTESVVITAVDKDGHEGKKSDEQTVSSPPSSPPPSGGDGSEDDNSTDEPQRGPSPRPTSPTPTSPHAKETPG